MYCINCPRLAVYKIVTKGSPSIIWDAIVKRTSLIQMLDYVGVFLLKL